jgi:hypothetical protein
MVYSFSVPERVTTARRCVRLVFSHPDDGSLAASGEADGAATGAVLVRHRDHPGRNSTAEFYGLRVVQDVPLSMPLWLASPTVPAPGFQMNQRSIFGSRAKKRAGVGVNERATAGNVDADYYPRCAYVDVAGADIYAADHGNLAPMFAQVKAVAHDTVPIYLHGRSPIQRC